MALSNRKKAMLRTQKRAGDMTAEGILDGLPELQLSKDVEGTVAANTIQVTGKVFDGATMVVVETFDQGANSTATVAASGGTAKAGNGTTKVWLTPTADGTFKVNILNAGVEDNLVIVTTNTGDVAMLSLAFA